MTGLANRQVLDCTLRDGGYINDWQFGKQAIRETFKRLVSSGVDFIEIGFLDNRRSFNENATIQPNTQAFNEVFAGLDKGNATVVGMIDFGTCTIHELQPAKDTLIDAIRVIFKQHKAAEALAFCKEIKALGYKVFSQMVSATTYSDEDLVAYAQMVNEVEPYGNGIVDTYGLMDDEKVRHIAQVLDKHLKPSIALGYHAHNNFQLGYANCVRFLNMDTERTLLVDGSLYGMGKSAGNAPIELITNYMNEVMGTSYDTLQMLEAIDHVILDIYQKQQWGYSLFFYVAAAAKVHPNCVSYIMNKRTLAIKQVMEVLEMLPEEHKLMFSAEACEEVYRSYQSVECDDTEARQSLAKAWGNKPILLLGPGPNALAQVDRIKETIARIQPQVVAINYIPDFIPTDYLFLTNNKRYSELLGEWNPQQELPKTVATSNVIAAEGNFDYTFRYSDLIDAEADVIDNSLVMFLKLAEELGLKDLYLAGFDGYNQADNYDNYFDMTKAYHFAQEKAAYFNDYVRAALAKLDPSIRIHFVTDSYYEDK